MRIGRYEIERELGRGAMGVVYLARDPRVKRRVAIKTWHVPEGLKPEQREEFRQRFLREAQAAGALNHPAIVTIYDADDDPERQVPFIAMEYVEGRSLDSIIAGEGPLDPEVACTQAQAVAEALAQAHEAGIVHRDIKPANLLIPAGGGAVKVADFGVARMASSELTRTGSSLGSPAYMSPEQIRGQPVDGRSDLFSLAAVLYESLCGERPFVAADLTALAYAVVYETPVPISRKRPGLPPGLDAFFERALAKNPGDRFPDAQAFRDALKAARTEAAPAGTQTLEFVDSGSTMVDAALAEPVGTPPGAQPREDRAKAAPAAASDPGGGGSTGSSGTKDSGWDAPATVHAAAAAGHLGALLLRGLLGAGRGLLAAGRLLLRGARGAGRGLLAAGRVILWTGLWIGRTAPVAARRIAGLDRRLLAAGGAIILLAAIGFGAWAMFSDGVTVRIKGVNGFREADLALFVDGEEVWSRSLAAEKKKASFMGKRLFNYGTEEFGGRIRLAPGRHEIVVSVLPEGESEPYTDRIRARLKPGVRRTLEIKTGKGLGRPVSIDLD